MLKEFTLSTPWEGSGVFNMKRVVIVLLIVMAILVVSACDLIAGNGGIDNNSASSVLTLGQTFEFNGFEITLKEDIAFARIVSSYLESAGAYLFYVPITLTNIGSAVSERNPFFGSNEQNPSLLTVFSPDGLSKSDHAVGELFIEFFETNVLAMMESVEPGATVERNLYIMYAQDGEYVIEFASDSGEVIKILKFMLEFDFDALPGTQTGLGETFDWGGLEITFAEDVVWGVIKDRWSERSGENYFLLHVSATNNSQDTMWFPGEVYKFGPNGHSLPYFFSGSDRDDIMLLHDAMLPGDSKSAYFHLLYVGEGEYTLQFRDWRFSDLNVSFHIEPNPGDLPEFQTEFSLGETFIVDNMEVTVIDDIYWGILEDEQLDFDGRYVMVLPVTVRNIGESTNNVFIEGTYGPDGIEQEPLGIWISADIVHVWDIGVGVTVNSSIHILYDGDGEYSIGFRNGHYSSIFVIFNVTQP